MLDLEKLSAGELATLSGQAGEECGRRFRLIAQAADPSDLALQSLLSAMAAETELQVLREEESLPFGSGQRRTPNGIREFIRTSIPSLTKRFGEGTLHRDNALFYAESLEEEASRFYRMLAEHAREAEARSLFTDLSDRELGKLRYLREVVLQS
jgi:hypothetical protein